MKNQNTNVAELYHTFDFKNDCKKVWSANYKVRMPHTLRVVDEARIARVLLMMTFSGKLPSPNIRLIEFKMTNVAIAMPTSTSRVTETS